MNNKNPQDKQFIEYDPEQKTTIQVTAAEEQYDSDDDYYVDENAFVSITKALSFNDLKNKTTVTLGDYDPKYQHRVVIPGLSLKGICNYENCRVKGQQVWIRVGYKTFEMCDQIYDSECPVCHQQIHYSTISTLGYRQAKVTITGRKILANGKTEKVTFQDEERNGKFTKFLQSEGSNVQWARMTVSVEKI